MALPSDRLEVVLDQFKTFAVGHCQCRMTERVLGRGCDRPLENCTVMGTFAEAGIRDGWARSVSKQALLDIKREAEASGLVVRMSSDTQESQHRSSCPASYKTRALHIGSLDVRRRVQLHKCGDDS
jgi:hypothetical protein